MATALLLVLISVLTVWGRRDAVDARAWVDHTREVQEELHQLQADFASSEATAALYLLKGSPAVHRQSAASRRQMLDHLDRLRSLTVDNQIQQARLSQLAPMLATKLDMLGESVKTLPSQPDSDAAASEGGPLIALDENIAQAFKRLADTEAELLKSRMERQNSRMLLNTATVIASTTTMFILGAFSIVMTSKELKMRRELAAQQEKMLRVVQESEERFRLLVANVKDYAIIFLDPAGHVSSWNAGAERIIGYSEAEITGRSLAVFYPPLAASGGAPERELEAARTTGRFEEEGLRMRKDGSTFWAVVVLTPIRTSDGRLIGFAKVTRDITERRQADLRLKEQSQRLQDANTQLEAFAYSVAHDLRAPLRAMHGFSQALSEDFGEQLGAEGQDYVRRIIESSKLLDSLIKDLLAYSRLSREEILCAPVALTTIVELAQQQVKSELAERGAEVDVAAALPVVRGHQAVLVQIMANLLVNGAKFVEKGVRPRLRVSVQDLGERVRVNVEDNGIGIAPEHRQRIFRIFERLHGTEAYPGTGIGLAIVSKGVERLGGSCGVDPAGHGSRFWIELPRAS